MNESARDEMLVIEADKSGYVLPAHGRQHLSGRKLLARYVGVSLRSFFA